MLLNLEIDTMSPEQCMDLAMILYDKASSLRDAQPLTEEQKKELEQRFQYDEAHPGNTIPWEEFMEKFSH